MLFNLQVQTPIGNWPTVQDFEEPGYDARWFSDTPMMWSDCQSGNYQRCLHGCGPSDIAGQMRAAVRLAPNEAACCHRSPTSV